MIHLTIKQMAHIINPPTLEFREAFIKGHQITYNDIPLILQCKNIDFGHVSWPSLIRKYYYTNEQLMFHIIDNIMDINMRDENLSHGLTLLCKIYTTNIHSSNNVSNYVMNNGYINNLTFTNFRTTYSNHYIKCCSMVHFESLVNYLTIISFDKFRGYYNIEKYYYMIHTMLLIMKAQQRLSIKSQTYHSLPNTIIKHLIIPFIYQ